LIDELIRLAIAEFDDNAKLHYDFQELGSEKLGTGLLTDEDKK
jgi:D-alanine-D-alanine ligase